MSPAPDSFMRQWEMGSPMRTFIYYLQRAICGALSYLILHQAVLGLRLLQIQGSFMNFFERLLTFFSIPGNWLCTTFFDPIRPLHLPPPLATFTLNIAFYFATVWLACFLYNLLLRQTFLGKRRDPFQLAPPEEKKQA